MTSTVAQAIAAISNAGLVPIVNYASSNTVPAGQIIPGSQSPAAGTSVTPGTQAAQISFTVSTGPPNALGNVTVPNVVGMFAQVAYDALAAVNLSVDKVTWLIASSPPEGCVISQTPTAGSVVPAGTIVKLTISMGSTRPANTVTVPTVS